MGVPRTAVRTGHCYRDSFGAVWRVVGFDGRGVICVLYHRDVCGALVERPHTETWDNFLADIGGEVACPARSSRSSECNFLHAGCVDIGGGSPWIRRVGRVLKIAARPASFIVAELRKRGIDAEPLLKEVGLARADLADPENRVPYAAVLGLAERAATATGDPGFGLRLGASVDPRDSGLLGFVLLNSPTLLDALANLKRYFQVIGEGEDFEIERGGPTITLRFRETDPALRGLRQNSDYLAAIVLRACRDLVRKRIVPRRVQFIHARPNGQVPYDEVLGCPVSFHAPWDALEFDAATLALPVVGADDRLLAALQAACLRILGPAQGPKDLVHDVRELMLDGLSRGTATLDAAAGALGLSPKTLERRLAGHGTSFTRLLDTLRADLAKQYLADTDFRLEQIAYLVGYSEPAALVRAFRRWTGTTPAAFRAARAR